MRSRVKTGDVIQIRRNGPNYITLGKVKDGEGVEFLAVTRNGNITECGKMKAPTSTAKPRVHIISGDSVKRVHGRRLVDMQSVISNDRRLGKHLTRTTTSTGIVTSAPNIAAQLEELASVI
jgi:hypothetical protein